MPGRSGPEILEDIAFLTEEPNWMPVLVLTADIAPDTKRRALSLGARDFLTKPIDVPEVLLRVRNLLQTRYLRDRAAAHQRPPARARARSARAELEDAKLEMLDRLALAAEYRDDATGQHAERIGRTSELLALELGLEPAEATLIGQAARLHDIGKIGIADDLLLKPGKYTAEEFDAMKLHPAIGARILSGSTNELLMMAEQIALTHHERWDGTRLSRAGSRARRSRCRGGSSPSPTSSTRSPTAGPTRSRGRSPTPCGRSSASPARKFDPRVIEAFARLDHAALVQPAARRPGALAAVEAERRAPGRRQAGAPTARPRAASRRCSVDQRLAQRDGDGLRAGVALELGHRVLHVRAHRERGDRERAARPARRACPRTAGAGRRARAWSASACARSPQARRARPRATASM